MPTSSWDTLETRLYDTLVAVKTPVPGNNPGDPPGPPAAYLGNVHRYKPEHVHGDDLSDYFYSAIGGEPVLRGWYVWVTGQLDFETHQTTTVRMTAEIRAFYEKGSEGAGARLLKDHMSIVHQALRALGRNLGGACTLILSWERYDPTEADIEVADGEGLVLTAGHTIVCERINGVP